MRYTRFGPRDWSFTIDKPLDLEDFKAYVSKWAIEDVLKTLRFTSMKLTHHINNFEPKEAHRFSVTCDGNTKKILEGYPGVIKVANLTPQR